MGSAAQKGELKMSLFAAPPKKVGIEEGFGVKVKMLSQSFDNELSLFPVYKKLNIGDLIC